MTQPSLSSSAQKVQDALQAFGLALRVVELPDSTRTAPEAASAIGCQVGQIVKSLVFQGVKSGQPYLALVSGANRASESRLADLLGEPVKKANADFVRVQTGFAIGGVPPVGHTNAIETLVDEDLLAYAEIWAAAGTPRAVFRLTPDDLLRITASKAADIKEA